MQKDQKFTILSEGQIVGVSKTCQKYKISRTVYYKWLKRYHSLGINGLNDIKRTFTPPNKTNPEIEATTLSLIKTYPQYGPRSIKYLLEELNFTISESAVFNIMKRNNLTNKEKRIRYTRKKVSNETEFLPSLKSMSNGEGWLFWVTDCGYFPYLGNLYSYTLLDIKSKLACSRIYTDLLYSNFETLLTAVALPIAQSLNMNPKYLCLFNDSKLIKTSLKGFPPNLNDVLSERGFEMDIHLMEVNKTTKEFLSLREEYTTGCITTLLPLVHDKLSFVDIKAHMQQYIRHYNLKQKSLYETSFLSPIEYHNQLTNSKSILPIWAYIDRPY